MASSGNTWFKKLRNKQRLHSLKVKGVKQRHSIDNGNDYVAAPRPAVMFGRQPRRFGSVPSALPPQSAR